MYLPSGLFTTCQNQLPALLDHNKEPQRNAFAQEGEAVLFLKVSGVIRDLPRGEQQPDKFAS